MSLQDTKAEILIKKAAEELKKIPEIKPLEWAKFAKTGRNRERPPIQKDWWYTRAASILRKVYLLGPVGTSKLKRKYGGKKNRGHKPERTYKGAGSIVRKILQQLETAELIKKTTKKGHKGRVLTKKGNSFLDKVSK